MYCCCGNTAPDCIGGAGCGIGAGAGAGAFAGAGLNSVAFTLKVNELALGFNVDLLGSKALAGCALVSSAVFLVGFIL